MASDGKDEVSLREKLYKKSRGSIFIMSRRRISCKDLGNADCQGWMYKKKEKTFLGNKWKKFWAVLKGSCLYWYTNQMAEKAEGFINLPDFIVNPALECKKKHAIKVTHPQIKTFYFAAENREEMNKWLNKLGIAVIARPVEEKKEEDCWSESEQDDQDTTEIPAVASTVQHKCSDSKLHDSSSLSSELTLLSEGTLTLKSVSSVSTMEFHVTQSRLHIEKHSSAPEIERLIMVKSVHQEGSQNAHTDNASLNSISNEDVAINNNIQVKDNDDEMAKLYKSLEEASLSPIGERRPSSKRELRKSFIKRCKNPSINEKLHKIRTLNSTLKCKEHDLVLINQLLETGELTAEKYREWKNLNTILFVDIYSPACDQDISTAETSHETSTT
uniref:PH domain-containing protein n=1 Tax=Leptobrachium leishanense TaxID=445787 RepID=A0A8C5PNV9_9ANUR